MRQTSLSVPLDVKPDSYATLARLIDEIRHDPKQPGSDQPDRYERITALVPALHFMSISVFPGHDYDPIFILEANFDGDDGVFWGQMEAAFGEALRDMLRCCKKPLDGDGLLFDAVTAVGSRAAVIPYFERRVQRPSAFHHGNRGLSRECIIGDRDVFLAVRAELASRETDPAQTYRALHPEQIHARLRAAMLPRFAWLAEAAPVRVSRWETALDWVRLLLFVAAIVGTLLLPGLVIASLTSSGLTVLLPPFIIAGIGVWVWLLRRALPGMDIPATLTSSTAIKLLAAVLAGAALLTAVLPFAIIAVYFGSHLLIAYSPWLAGHVGDVAVPAYREALRPAAVAVLVALTLAALLILAIRFVEQRESWQDDPPQSERMLRNIVRREDWIAQNHMGSLVLIKPGVLRSLIIRLGHRGLVLYKRTDPGGYLGSMRTVHFAHWAFLNNNSRLIFLSNFDQSWGSYLDDFIEKASIGLTLAWGSGIGFPPARFLVLDGATHGRMFKNWALASRTVSRFWYSAYRDLTVDQIERNWRIACGLRRPSMQREEAQAWLLDL